MYFNTLVLFPTAALAVASSSNTIQMLQMTMLSVQCVYTVTTGSYSLQLQESIDGTNWHDVSGAVQAVAATGKIIFKVPEASSLYYKVAIAKSSGTIDALTITAHAKGL